LLSLVEENSFFSILSQIVEFMMDQSDLLVSKTISLSIDQTFDGSELIDKDELLIISVEVDGIKIGV